MSITATVASTAVAANARETFIFRIIDLSIEERAVTI